LVFEYNKIFYRFKINATMPLMNKSFNRGFKSIFSIMPNDQTRRRVPNLTVEKRIKRNWDAVGNSLRTSLNNLKSEQKV